MSRRRALFFVGGVMLAAITIYFTSLYFDPIVNYYGIRLRKSELTSLLVAHTPTHADFGLYCIAQPLPSLAEQSICFDSERDFRTFADRRNEVEQQLRGDFSSAQ